jgi:HD-GYP domain-containing protein (c-di-GMP phosphodiesterase class II)
MKFSDMFRKKDDAGPALPKGIKPEGSEEYVADVTAPATKDTSNVKISSVLNQELEKISVASSLALYEELLARAKHIYTTAELKAEPDFVKKLNPLIEKVADTLHAGNTEIILACLKDYPSMDEFLHYHIVNVTISAMAMAMSLNYEKQRLVEIGVAAFVHDIGTKSIEVDGRSRIFSESDHNKMRRHPDVGATILSNIDPGMSQRILDAVRQEHERADGSGYPQGLTKDSISEYAQIIGLADVYEAMMHQRPYRDKYTSLETVRIILSNKRIFSRKVTKALLETFGIFPVDTLVQLNTKEIGVVVKPNLEAISRPVIDILIDSYGKELKQPKRINMAENPVIYVDTCVRTQVASNKI